MNRYLLNEAGETIGPFEEADVRAWIAGGHVPRDTLACGEGQEKWELVNSILKVWRDDSASERQLESLDAYGIRPDLPITKGEATDLLTAAMKPEKDKRKGIAELERKLSSRRLANKITKAEASLRSCSLTRRRGEEMESKPEAAKGEREALKELLREAGKTWKVYSITGAVMPLPSRCRRRSGRISRSGSTLWSVGWRASWRPSRSTLPR